MGELHSLPDGWSADVHEQQGWQVVRLLSPGTGLGDVFFLADHIWQTVAHWSLPRLVLDMSQVDFVSSSLMGVMVRLHKRTASAGGALHICGLQPSCREALHACRLHEILPEFSDIDAATRYAE